jgi:hypothetical protein
MGAYRKKLFGGKAEKGCSDRRGSFKVAEQDKRGSQLLSIGDIKAAPTISVEG